YARERLGIAPRTAQALCRLSSELATRPILCRAVWLGEVSVRKAQVVLNVARGDQEAAWVERARTQTVRALAAAVRQAGADRTRGDGDGTNTNTNTNTNTDPDGEKWDVIALMMPPEARVQLDAALALARRVLGGTPSRWQCIEAMCQEYLSGHAPMGEIEPCCLRGVLPEGWVEKCQAYFEESSQRWDYLDNTAVNVVTPPLAVLTDPFALDVSARMLMETRGGWDELVGRLAMLVKMEGLWRDMQFATFGHYCSERLGLSERTVSQRVWLERQLWSFPSVRTARGNGRLTYAKALLVARCLAGSLDCDDRTEGGCVSGTESGTEGGTEGGTGDGCENGTKGGSAMAAIISWAESHTCQELQEVVDAQQERREERRFGREERERERERGLEQEQGQEQEQRTDVGGRQMCAPRPRRRTLLIVPRSVGDLVEEAVGVARQLARAAGKPWIDTSEALLCIAEHFIEVWKDQAPKGRAKRERLLERGGGRCQVPGCTRA
ncbi:MAG: hypothetical protein A3K19_25325, partial [Lentisphaerae bacterium RIFOXYB12_FULL_65_16]